MGDPFFKPPRVPKLFAIDTPSDLMHVTQKPAHRPVFDPKNAKHIASLAQATPGFFPVPDELLEES